MEDKLKANNQVRTGIYAAIVVFFAYTMIFGFRKAFTVATFDGLTVGGYSYKTVLVVCQMLGYLFAKFYGIKYISALKRSGRGKIILLFAGLAWLSWLFFAIVPLPYNAIFLFLNGFPLGMLWGVVFSYVEGRRSTDFIGATLAVSFVFASGFVKSVGAWLMLQFGISEFWIPFFTCLCFAIPLVIFVWLMEKIPAPDQDDIAFRAKRVAMDESDRRQLLRSIAGGFITCILIYTFATIFRDIRDNFGAEMWKEMGYFNKPALFSKTETPITLIVLLLIGSMVVIKNNYKALTIAHLFIGLGFIIAGISTVLFKNGNLAPIWWMTAVGLGLYMVYIPFNAVFFERLIATFKYTGNVGFLIYIADSVAYVGSIGVLICKEFLDLKMNWVNFYTQSVIWLSLFGLLLTLFSHFYFRKKVSKERNLQSGGYVLRAKNGLDSRSI